MTGGLPLPSRRALQRALAVEPVLRASRRVFARRVVVLMYHEVLEDNSPVDAWTVVRASDFERQLGYVRRHFDAVMMDEALAALRGGRRSARNLAVVTFDDGYAGNARIVQPIAEALRVPITIFAATGWIETATLYWYDRVILALHSPAAFPVDLRAHGLAVYDTAAPSGERRWTVVQQVLTALKQLTPAAREHVANTIAGACGVPPSGPLRPLTPAEVRTMSGSPWVSFGAHTHCHNRLTQLTAAEATSTVDRSRRLLEEWTGGSVRHFAYPNGDWSPEIMELVGGSGFATAVTTQPGLWSAKDAPLAIPRISVGRYDHFDVFKARLSGMLL